ncbi:signal peptidase II [Actinomyces johnsonii]|uniref:Lipoprotein signal peptidase n=1 Tax=Actinomyces johnsonii TaxID=544581 RepID=A0A508A312_9ACTO|nr:signal peptidase II [Actinomyces johnsonii]KAA8740150.1 signal peptidase II [Actinomyces johnsonii]TQD44279.1 signal peptidase II [Actinomyces johnsonii]
MPDHVDAATPPEEAADNIVSLPTDNPFSAMEKSLGAQGGRDGEGRRARRLSVTVLWTMAVVIVVVDQLSKQWALSALSDGQHTALLGRALGLVLVRNPGAAFSFATGQTWIFALIASLVVVIIVRVSRNLASRSWAVALGLVLGGAVGNLIDRLLREPGFLRGHVIDFIDYGGYFVGNVADIAIVLAAAGIIVLSLGGWEIDGTRAASRSTPEPKGADGSQTPAHAAGAAVRQGDAAAPSMPAMPTEPE